MTFWFYFLIPVFSLLIKNLQQLQEKNCCQEKKGRTKPFNEERKHAMSYYFKINVKDQSVQAFQLQKMKRDEEKKRLKLEKCNNFLFSFYRET